MLKSISLKGKNTCVNLKIKDKKIIFSSYVKSINLTPKKIFCNNKESNEKIVNAYYYLSAFLDDYYSEDKDEMINDSIKFRFNHDCFIDAVICILNNLDDKLQAKINEVQFDFNYNYLLSKDLILLKSCYLAKDKIYAVSNFVETDNSNLTTDEVKFNRFRLTIKL